MAYFLIKSWVRDYVYIPFDLITTWDSDYFADPWHLLPEGAEIHSNNIGKAIQEIIK